MSAVTPDLALDPRLAELPISPTLAARARITELARQGRDVFKLGLGQSPFPIPEPVVAALRANAAQRDYLPVQGLPALREAVADYHRRRIGLSRAAEDVSIGPGSKELLFLLQLCFDGEVLIPAPGWVSYGPQARICGRRARYLEPTGPGMILAPDVLDDHCRRKRGDRGLLILNLPSNPTGSTLSTEQLKDLAEVCRAHRLVVLSDEIYGELSFEGQHASLAQHYPEGTIVATGLSKWCGAGGWRLGAFSFPPSLRPLAAAMAAAGSETYSATCAPVQHAAVEAFRGGPEIERYLASVRRIQGYLCRWAARALRQAGLEVPEPHGGFYVFASFEPHRALLARRGIFSDVALVARMLTEIGLSSVAGSEFGMPRDSLHARLALVDFDGARALAAEASQLVDQRFVARYAERVVNAVAVITGWLEATDPP
jgi:aspartate aminotransferase